MTFDQAFDRLIDHEGGYVNDPKDPGGETKFGISKRSYPGLDIKNLTRDEARLIYRSDYWMRARLDQMPPALAFQVFDAAVNSGIENAVRFLQRAVSVADDGHIGAITMTAINTMQVWKVLVLFDVQRLLFMTKLSIWDHEGRGWARRIAQNLIYATQDA